MATVSNYALRLPASLMAELKRRAEQDGVSVNQFISIAVAEKLSAMRTRDYFARRAARAVGGEFEGILAKAGTEAPVAGDEVPEGWLEEALAGERDERSAGRAARRKGP